MNPPEPNNRAIALQQQLQQHHARLAADQETPITVEGRLTRMVGLTLEAVGFQASVGSRCEIMPRDVNRLKLKWLVFMTKRFI